jgi:serine/threonine protein kinase
MSVTRIGFNKSIESQIKQTTQENFKFELEDFTILHTLGKGSSAIVKLAKHKKMNCKVAFKIYDKYKLLESQRKRSLLKEIEI